MLSALSLAALAPNPLLAQTSSPSALLSETASLLPYSVAWATTAVSEHAGPTQPPVAVEFAGVFAIPCSDRILHDNPDLFSNGRFRDACPEAPSPEARFLNSTMPAPLSPEQKAHLAFHNLKDPGNLATIIDIAAFTIGTNSHTAYGPGWGGFGKNVGYTYLQDATGEFFGTFLIPSLTHEDPRYHRMPDASIPRRVVHAISHTVLSQSDHGATMLNYSALLTYPISAEISNLYVPGINDNGPSTVRRIMIGYATDPIDNLVTEFLPDVARHVHVRVIFVQRVLNQVSSDQYSLP